MRNFIYLDSAKLRSLSSQLFEGITEQLIVTKSENDTKSEQQKGPINSGQILADIFATEQSSAELKFLEDHAYDMFETKLLELEKLQKIEDRSEHTEVSKAFIHVTGRLALNDLEVSAKMLKNYNAIGEALWRVGNQQTKLPDKDIRKLAEAANLQMDQKFTSSAATLIEFGFSDLLEARIAVENQLFSAPLKRTSLRESETMLVQKYSRVTEQSFTIMGVVTRQGNSAQVETPPEVADADNIKDAMRNLSLHLRVLENQFLAPSANEVIVDPIAIYSTL